MPARDQRHEAAAAWPEVQEWLVDLELAPKSPRTLYAYERATAPLLRSHPGKTLAEFTTADLNAELRLIPERSRYISRSIYNQLFEWAVFQERIEKSPMWKVQKMRAGHRRRKDIFAPDEILALAGLPVPDGPLFQILFGTGLRRAEARHLRRSDINLDRMRLTVCGKGRNGGKERLIPFNMEVATAVADLDLLERLEPTDYLWYLKRYPVGDRRRRRDPIGDTTWDTWYRDKIRQADVRMLNPHQTRHTYAWWLEDSDKIDLNERQALLGHSSPDTTVKYGGRGNFEKLAAKVAAL